jgi:aminoglycoside phosphotransferase (APT) family kinase protein
MEKHDGPGNIRKGEELSLDNLEAFIKTEMSGIKGAMTVKQFPGGHSNLTYLIRFGDVEMVMRRPPFGTNVKSAHDMGREHAVLKALAPVFPCAPKPLLYAEDTSIIGCPFLIMERLKGIIIRGEIPENIDLSGKKAKTLCLNLIETQHALHSVDYHRVGLENFGKPSGYMGRQVKGWCARYEGSKTPDAPDCRDLMTWFEDHIPPDSDHPGIVHGDYKFDNVLLDLNNPVTISGILDWEMATIGDPISDLAYTLMWWPGQDAPESAAMGSLPPALGQSVCREELVEFYESLAGYPLNNLPFYFSFNLFRLGVILQQIYYRYYHGITEDERFGAFKATVQLLMAGAGDTIEKQ